jgi:uncharacterized protein (DUF697 family)
MPNPLKLASLWRVIKDLDLDGVRLAARTRFTLALVAEAGDDATRLRELLTGPGLAPHPWIEIATLGTSAPASAGATGGKPQRGAIDALSALSAAPLAGILITPAADLSDTLKLAGNRFAASSTPVLTVVVSDTSHTAKVLRPGERGRVAVERLDDSAIDAIATALTLMLSDDQHVALGAHFPPLRPVIFARIIERTARANASFALTTGLAETIPVLTAPLNLGDMVVLTKNQLMMCYRLALAAGRDEEPKAMMTEIIGVLGSGVLFRQAARQLVGLIPIAGLLPKVAISYAGTYAIGKAMVAWTTEGKQVTVDSLAAYSRDGLVKGRALAEHLVEGAGATGGRVARRFERLRAWLPRRVPGTVKGP